jgi:hypothetical protein
MKYIIIFSVISVLFIQEVLIFEKKNWNKLVKASEQKYEQVMEKLE